MRQYHGGGPVADAGAAKSRQIPASGDRQVERDQVSGQRRAASDSLQFDRMTHFISRLPPSSASTVFAGVNLKLSFGLHVYNAVCVRKYAECFTVWLVQRTQDRANTLCSCSGRSGNDPVISHSFHDGAESRYVETSHKCSLRQRRGPCSSLPILAMRICKYVARSVKVYNNDEKSLHRYCKSQGNEHPKRLMFEQSQKKTSGDAADVTWRDNRQNLANTISVD